MNAKVQLSNISGTPTEINFLQYVDDRCYIAIVESKYLKSPQSKGILVVMQMYKHSSGVAVCSIFNVSLVNFFLAPSS